MHYRLLRNNKESGPYTTNQLLEMGLKPYDLLWAEGKSASWQYPSEIEELKAIAPVIEEQPYDRFFKKDAKPSVAVAQKSKPRFRISAGKIVMVEEAETKPAETVFREERLKSVAAVQVAAKEQAPANPAWQEVYSEWKKPLENAEENDAAPVITEKYSQSLDDLKKQYEEKVLNKKEEKFETAAASRKQNIMAAIAVLVLALGSFAGYKLKQNNNNPSVTTQAAPAIEHAEIADGNNLNDPSDKGSAKSLDKVINTLPAAATTSATEASQNIKVSQENLDNTPAVKKGGEEQIAKNAVDKNKAIQDKERQQPAAKPVTNAPATADKKVVADNRKDVQQPEQKKAVTTGTPNNAVSKNTSSSTAPVAAPPVVKPAAKKRISDYVAVKKSQNSGSETSVQNMHLAVQNISDFPIDLAVIDIQYYDAHGKYQKGETMYVKGINSGDNVDVRVPDSRNSKSITYKVSMVSAEQKTLYMVGD